MDYLAQYIESTDIVSSPLTIAETDIHLSMWSQVYIEPFLGEVSNSNFKYLDVFDSQQISHFYDEFALGEYRKQRQDSVFFVLTTDGSPGLLCREKLPEDLQRFCMESGRRPGGPACELVVCSDDFKWTFASNSKNLFFAYAPIEVNLEVLAVLHSTALKRLIPGR